MKTKFMIMLLALSAFCACAALDDSELPGVDELGADVLSVDEDGRKYIEIPSDGGQTLISVLANRKTQVVLEDDCDWLSATPAAFEADQEVAVAYKENTGFSRAADVVFVSETRRDTVAVRQKGGVEEIFSFPVTNAVIYNSESGNSEMVTEVPVALNVPLGDVIVDVLYFNGQDWVSDVEVKEDRILVTTLDNATEELHTAHLVLSWYDGWGLLRRGTIVLKQVNKDNRIGTDISFEDLRAMATVSGNSSLSDLILTGYIVSDMASMNTGENKVEDERVVEFDDEVTVYLESLDGSCGFKLLLNSSGDNVFRRNTKVSMLLDGAVVSRTADEPVRYVISSLSADNLLTSEQGSIPVKEKYISELTDDDIYTFVTLRNCELPVRKGGLTNVNEGYFSIDRYVGKHPVLVRDVKGGSLYMYTNVDCPYRRDGRRLPNGSGTISGIITHEKHRSFTELDMNGVLNADENLRGWIGRYQIRHQSWEDIALAENVNDGFSTILAEWRYITEDLLNPETLGLRPSFPSGSDAEFNHSNTDYTGSDATIGRFSPSTDWCYIGPMEGKTVGNYGYGIILEDGTDYLADTEAQNADNKGQASAAKGMCWTNKYWWNSKAKKGYAWVISFSTEGISTDNISMQISTWGRTSSSAPHGGSPRYWKAEWSETGDMDSDADWTRFGEYTVPDQVVYQQTRLHQSVGFKPVDLPLPLEILGKKKVYVRLMPSVNKASDGTLDGEQSENIKINNKRANAIEYVAVRYNK